MPEDLERQWEVTLTCGHTHRAITVIGDFDYEALLRDEEIHLCTVCRYTLKRPIRDSFHGLVSVTQVPTDTQED